MYQIDSSGSVSVRPEPAAAGTPGWFTPGNPATGEPATILDADWFNALQAEMLSILAAAGITPNKAVSNQILTAMQGIFAPLAGSAEQKFSVAAAADATDAVNLGQFLASLTANGYFEIPVIFSGVQKTLIVQWVTTAPGDAPAGGGTSLSGIAWPTPFPNACLQAVATADATGWTQNTASAAVFGVTNTTFGAILENFGTTTQTGRVRVIGIGW